MISARDRPLGAVTAALLLACLPVLSACTEEGALPEDPLERAENALQSGDGIAAEADLRRAMDAGVARARVAALMGEAQLAQGNLAEARIWLEPGEFAPQMRAKGFHLLGQLEVLSGNLAAAGAAYDRALAEDPDNPELWVDIGRLRYRGGEQLQAIEAAERAVALGPANAAALHFRGQLLRDSHGMAAALPWFEAALKQDPGNPAVLADYAATLGELGRAKEMLAAVRHLAEVDPDNPQVHFLQAVLAARGGKPVLARALLQRSGNLERQVPAAMLLSALIDMQNANHASAAQQLARLAERQPDNHRVQALLARALLLGRSENELIYRYADRATRPGASPYLMTLVGRAHEGKGNRGAAAPFLDAAAKPLPAGLVPIEVAEDYSPSGGREDASGAEIFASIRADIGSDRSSAAVRKSRELLQRYAGSADALSLAGDAAFAGGDVQGAIERYEASAAVRRPWPLTKRMIMAYREAGQGDEANALLYSHLKGEPGNAEAAGMAAAALADMRRWSEAASMLHHALAHGGGRDTHLLALRARIADAQAGEESLTRSSSELARR
ncbi:Tetratricopeptide repeat-containing protein [Altererythrobacter xiamenensis]|uniref:Tetratricopeptide repeat-containing protein n=1 Tax=Altererythrobacter xiamenensis TaxID=1316679 RepID=A0A1Y6FHL8_9SPHN|nr:tetratricopeptide repeat protein [Altererythrobacter xiamenensis]SMQ74345.1 Tetratricopeptide repeat-containing protein [Altererythrobacter xiamenensis]